MSSYRIAIVGPQESISGFALLGVDTVPVNTPQEGIAALHRLKKDAVEERGVARNVYGIVFATEDIMSALSPDDERRLSRGALPAIIPLPAVAGGTGYGLERLKKITEHAIGSNILQ
jgi:V/A-type H+-transporting ATPase subunit F